MIRRKTNRKAEKIDLSEKLARLSVKLNTKVREIQQKFLLEIATKHARNFPQTLRAFGGRIPNQAKAFNVSLKVAGFVNSNRNAAYTPAKMLLLSSADFDGDDFHILLYSVDKNGEIYDFHNFLDSTGNISRAKFIYQFPQRNICP